MAKTVYTFLKPLAGDKAFVFTEAIPRGIAFLRYQTLPFVRSSRHLDRIIAKSNRQTQMKLFLYNNHLRPKHVKALFDITKQMSETEPGDPNDKSLGNMRTLANGTWYRILYIATHGYEMSDELQKEFVSYETNRKGLRYLNDLKDVLCEDAQVILALKLGKE